MKGEEIEKGRDSTGAGRQSVSKRKSHQPLVMYQGAFTISAEQFPVLCIKSVTWCLLLGVREGRLGEGWEE